jgi:hypothetical protein
MVLLLLLLDGPAAMLKPTIGLHMLHPLSVLPAKPAEALCQCW